MSPGMFPWAVTMPTPCPGRSFQDDYGRSLRALPAAAHPAVHGHLLQRLGLWHQELVHHLGLQPRSQEDRGGNTT